MNFETYIRWQGTRRLTGAPVFPYDHASIMIWTILFSVSIGLLLGKSRKANRLLYWSTIILILFSLVMLTVDVNPSAIYPPIEYHLYWTRLIVINLFCGVYISNRGNHLTLIKFTLILSFLLIGCTKLLFIFDPIWALFTLTLITILVDTLGDYLPLPPSH